MTLQYGEEKPSLEELAHFGVKGMKWGKRKARPSSDDIKDARARQAARGSDVRNKVNALNLATAKGSGVSQKKQDAAAQALVKSIEKLNKNPDAAVAARMTRGEKVASLLIAGPIGAIAIGVNKAHVKKLEKQNS